MEFRMSEVHTRYFLAKYLPDIRRGEPRNIGVIVWSPFGLAARFLAEEDQATSVDGRSVPSFVTSVSAYKQWIQYWRYQLTKDEISSAPSEGSSSGSVSRRSPDFIDAMMKSSRGNFLLTEGGFVVDSITEDDLTELTDHLFNSLVETAAQEEPRDRGLEEVCDELLKESSLWRDHRFQRHYAVECPVANTTVIYLFNYAVFDSSLRRLYQLVPLSKRRTSQQKNIHDAAWTFQNVSKARIIPPEDTAALVFIREEQKKDDELRRYLDELKTVTRVIDLGNEDGRKRALHEFTEVAARGA
jgi:hypothetical protein